MHYKKFATYWGLFSGASASREAQERLREAHLAEARFNFVQILWKISFRRISDLDSILF
jgi:hypothetical protein